MKACEYLHATLIAMLVIPLLYALAELEDAGGALMLYIKCFIIIIPVAVTELAVRKIRRLGLYLLAGAAATAALYGIMELFFGESGACYTCVMPAESVLIVLIRLRERMRLAAQEKENDIYAAPEISMINKPSFAFMWYFAVMYLLGIAFNSAALCDIAFFNAGVYFFVALAHGFLASTKQYFDLNSRTKNIPGKRLYAVGAAMTGAFAGLVLIAMLPSVFLAGQRRYTDIRTWFDEVEPAPYAAAYDVQTDGEAVGTNWLEVMNDGEPVSEPSKFWEYFWRALVAAIAGAGAYAGFYVLRQFFRDFRSSFDENGDRVEEIDGGPEDKTEGLGQKRRRREGSEAARVRRLYKKTIRRHRKEAPAPYESPAELEENAGLSGDAAMEALHVQYENVRYGKCAE
ncbi:MAG: hypothetical protein LUE96_05280 [Lachnospiraceae bacterium]|nr:hypothetical protein [Lachnospiraceae bacterium]